MISLIRRFSTENVLLSFIFNLLDLALISETHFTTNTKFSIPGYNIITSNHPDNTSHAGAAIIIKPSLLYTTIPNIQENYLQAAILSIKLNHIPITIAATYCPP
uniref:RNA-directed DNA polymerase from mobile element jockey n=1 Tax=Sipha flava TaxID=143950 RepID=A0A2S2QVE3_9HEMI